MRRELPGLVMRGSGGLGAGDRRDAGVAEQRAGATGAGPVRHPCGDRGPRLARYRGPLPRRPIVVPSDDGHRSHYTTAMPVLRRHGWPGVLSLTIEDIEDSITPRQVRRLVEIRDSRRIIRRIFGVRANNSTYPAGMYDGRAVAAVRAAGYRGAVTVAPGLASRDNRLEIRRIRVTDDMGTRGLAAAHGR